MCPFNLFVSRKKYDSLYDRLYLRISKQQEEMEILVDEMQKLNFYKYFKKHLELKLHQKEGEKNNGKNKYT